MNFEGISQERLVRFACDCALVNIELIKPYTDEYDLIIEWLKNPDDAAADDVIYYAAAAARTAAAATAAAAYAAAYAAAAAADYTAYTVEWAKAAGNPERIDALYEELMK